MDRMHDFYTNVLGLSDIPASQFPRTQAQGTKGFDGPIKFATDGGMQMHLAERALNLAFHNGHTINPLDRGHIAFRTDDLQAFLDILQAHNIPYSDYGTTFSQDWHQVFFMDPEGNIIEVHQQVHTP
ncbi:MAG: VOC family protein [Pseudomonadota bacterium]